VVNAATGDRTGLEDQVSQAVTSPINSRPCNVAKTLPYVQDGVGGGPLEVVRVMARVHLTGQAPADFASDPMRAAGAACRRNRLRLSFGG